MSRIAVIFESSPFDRKGLFNAVHNRVKGLLATGECWVDAYCVHSRDNAFTRAVRHTSYAPSVESVEIEGITYRILWYRFSILDHLTLEKLGKRPCLFRSFLKTYVRYLEGYDYVIAHSFTGGLFAYEAKQRYGIPYFASWHGSDVHTHPWRVGVIREDTQKIMESAECNFFVSKALMKESDRITLNARKQVLYNGVGEEFMRFDEAGVAKAREQFGIAPGEKVVAFAGNLSAVKNILVLPQIFKKVSEQFAEPLHFLIAGDGKLRRQLEDDFMAIRHMCGIGILPPPARGRDPHCGRGPMEHIVLSPATHISFLGNVEAEDMPALMNCVDVLVLPSLNEGLPLVCAEALKCGANVVGSDVGGIAEVIGHQNVVPHGPDFVSQFAQKVVSMLEARAESSDDALSAQQLPPEISWAKTTALELSFLK